MNERNIKFTLEGEVNNVTSYGIHGKNVFMIPFTPTKTRVSVGDLPADLSEAQVLDIQRNLMNVTGVTYIGQALPIFRGDKLRVGIQVSDDTPDKLRKYGNTLKILPAYSIDILAGDGKEKAAYLQ